LALRSGSRVGLRMWVGSTFDPALAADSS
jgi:hypothetical protein